MQEQLHGPNPGYRTQQLHGPNPVCPGALTLSPTAGNTGSARLSSAEHRHAPALRPTEMRSFFTRAFRFFFSTARSHHSLRERLSGTVPRDSAALPSCPRPRPHSHLGQLGRGPAGHFGHAQLRQLHLEILQLLQQLLLLLPAQVSGLDLGLRAADRPSVPPPDPRARIPPALSPRGANVRAQGPVGWGGCPGGPRDASASRCRSRGIPMHPGAVPAGCRRIPDARPHCLTMAGGAGRKGGSGAGRGAVPRPDRTNTRWTGGGACAPRAPRGRHGGPGRDADRQGGRHGRPRALGLQPRGSRSVLRLPPPLSVSRRSPVRAQPVFSRWPRCGTLTPAVMGT